MNTQGTLRDILRETLDIGDRADSLADDTPLLGNLPELDSMAVVEVVAGLEQQFGITVYDDEVDAEAFATFGSLVKFVEGKQQ
jgi:acyl carrier protein